jgi:O-antigen/teichoic acid export membrane protein
MAKSLGNLIVQGGFILVLLRLLIRGLGLISTMILFRILAPEDFGIVSLSMTVIGAIEVLAEFGFDQALIQKQKAIESDYEAVWTLMVLRGMGVSIILLLIAHPAALFLEDCRLEAMIILMALAPLIDGLQNVGIVKWNKELQFNNEFIFKLSQKLFSFSITLACAFWLRNYWALIIGVLSGKLAGLVLSYLMHSFRPKLNFNGWRSIFTFSQWIMFTNVVLYTGNQTDKVLLQKYIDTHTVGIFRIAEEISSSTIEFIWPVEKALYPGFTKVIENINELGRYLFNSIGLISMIGLPISIGMGIIAEPLVIILLGPNAQEAVPFIQVLTIHGAIRCCQVGIPNFLTALGRPSIVTRMVMAVMLIRLTALFYGIPLFGSIAAAWSLVIASCFSFLLNWFVISRILKVAWWRFPIALLRNVISVVLMSLVVLQIDSEILLLFPSANAWLILIERILVGATSYPLILLFLWLLCGKSSGPESLIINSLRARLNFSTTS